MYIQSYGYYLFLSYPLLYKLRGCCDVCFWGGQTFKEGDKIVVVVNTLRCERDSTGNMYWNSLGPPVFQG